MLSENDPFEVVNAMKNLGHIYRTSNSHIQEEKENIFDSQCVEGESCLGCSFCDGMEYIENIRQDEGLDIGDEEEVYFPDVGEVFCVDSDDENLDLFAESDLTAAAEENLSKSFWDHR